MTHPDVDPYFIQGCMRCPLGATPACKVHNWAEVLQRLRALLHTTPLTETLKWSVPCYTYQGNNVLILSAFKGYCAVSFFKGSLLEDHAGHLHSPGEQSQASRLFKFTSIEQVHEMEALLLAYIDEAITLEKEGRKVAFKKPNDFTLPDELLQVFEQDVDFKMAFLALTPGRQRGYQLYFSSPKQPKTRLARIEKYRDWIMAGKGIHDKDA
jgi:uncharacterized protein YdeI (YjbR/CyaY-like superfamily)